MARYLAQGADQRRSRRALDTPVFDIRCGGVDAFFGAEQRPLGVATLADVGQFGQVAARRVDLVNQRARAFGAGFRYPTATVPARRPGRVRRGNDGEK